MASSAERTGVAPLWWPRAHGWIVALPYVAQTLAAVVALGVAGRAGLDGSASTRYYHPAEAMAMLLAYLVLIGTSWWVARRFGAPAAVLGLRATPLARAAALIAVTFVVVSALGVLVLEPVFHGSDAQEIRPGPWPGGLAAGVAVALFCLVVVVIGPFAEELWFRGLALPALGGLGDGRRGAVGVGASALLFAAAHFTPRAIPVLFLLGVALALLARRTGSLWPAVALHALNNAVSIALTFGQAWT